MYVCVCEYVCARMRVWACALTPNFFLPRLSQPKKYKCSDSPLQRERLPYGNTRACEYLRINTNESDINVLFMCGKEKKYAVYQAERLPYTARNVSVYVL